MSVNVKSDKSIYLGATTKFGLIIENFNRTRPWVERMICVKFRTNRIINATCKHGKTDVYTLIDSECDPLKIIKRNYGSILFPSASYKETHKAINPCTTVRPRVLKYIRIVDISCCTTVIFLKIQILNFFAFQIPIRVCFSRAFKPCFL